MVAIVKPGPLEPGFLCGAEGASERSEYRLVKAPKSPTLEKRPFYPEKYQTLPFIDWECRGNHHLVDGGRAEVPKTPPGTVGAFATIQYREWANEYRIRSRIEGTVGLNPPEQSGARVSDDLSARGLRKIAESCQYVAAKKGGYKTFVTFTFDRAARCRIQAELAGPFSLLSDRSKGRYVTYLAGFDLARSYTSPYCKLSDRSRGLSRIHLAFNETFKGGAGLGVHKQNAQLVTSTIQREVSRFTDAMQKMYSRGWQAQFTQRGRKYYCAENSGAVMGQPENKGDLLYLWVVENPETVDRKTGEIGPRNPHVHMLLNWRVPYRMFPSWARRIEELWGHGFAHLERIKESQAAGAYMLKAAGYLSKAAGASDQGPVRGNRYGMSAEARAPDWVTLEEKQLHIMGKLIADVHQHLTEKYEAQYQQQRVLKAKRDRVPKERKAWRRTIGKQLEKIRRELELRCPVVASKYQIIIKGPEAFAEFMHWARSPGHWRAPIEWLPEKGPGEAWEPGVRPDTQWYSQFKKRHYWRRACRAAARLAWSDWEWAQVRDDYEQWEPVNADDEWGETAYCTGP
jgi:hypothetical protein